MKRLFKNDRELEFFFEDEVTIEQIAEWVVEKIELLDPNEAFSCNVEVLDGIIVVSGDEDSFELEVRDVVVQEIFMGL